MPAFLAKDFLSEYQQSNLRFLTTTLLTTPTHLDIIDNYIQTSKEKLSSGLEQLETENHDGRTGHKNDFHLQREKYKDVLLESYDSLTHQAEANPKNIIQIDSDSDFGISSSFDSFVMNAEDLDSMNKLMHPPLCAEEIKRLSPESEWFLEEINDADDETLPPIAVLNRKLRPVRVTDPFKEILRNNKGAEKISPFLDDGIIDNDSNVKNKGLDMTFEKIENIDCLVDSMQLEESLIVESNNDFIRLKETINLTLEELELYEIEERPDEKDWMKVSGDNVSSSQLECIESESQKMDLMQGTEPVSPEPRPDSNKLDSPETTFNSIDAPKLSNICAEKEDISDTDDLYIVSPKSRESLMKNIWNEEKIFGDILIMLLPENKRIDHKSSPVSIQLPQMSKEYRLNDDDYDGLEWDPLLHQYSLIATTEKCILEKVVPICPHQSKNSIAPFQKVDVNDDSLGEVVIEDWKIQENKIRSLQYITSCKKILSNGIPMSKINMEAPEGYHKPTIIERKEYKYIKNKDRILDKTPIPQSNKEKESISPLDTYLLLRKAKSQWNTSSDSESDKFRGIVSHVHKVVSAAKIKPMVVHEAKPFTKKQSSGDRIASEGTAFVKQNLFPDQSDGRQLNPFLVNKVVDNMNIMKKESSNASTYIARQNSHHSNSASIKEEQKSTINGPNPIDRKMALSSESSSEQFKSDDTDFSVERIAHDPKAAKKMTNSYIKKEKTLIKLKLGNKYEEFIKDLSDDLQTVLEFLRSHGCINHEYTVSTLTCERTLFLLKQEENKFNAGNIDHDIFSGVLCLHALTQVIDTIVNCNILSACAILKSMTQTHESILGNCLEPLHKKLLSFFCGGEENHVIHPKLKKIQYLLASWLKNDPACRTIILIRRMFEFVAPNLQNFLSAIKGVNVYLYPSQDASESVYLDVFYKSNVILVHNQNDIQSCPWQYFQYAIEFEESTNSWCELAFAGNPELKQYLSFKDFWTDYREPNTSDLRVNSNTGLSGNDQRTIPILCTPSVAKEKELLLALENKLNIQLTVKDYSKLDFYVFPEFSFQPDIVIDEHTGIILVYVVDFLDSDEMFDIMQKKIISAAIKCTKVYILLYKESSKSNESLFGKMLSHIVPLMAKIHINFKHVTCKVLQTFSIKGLAKKIRLLCDKSLEGYSAAWNKEYLNSKNWLKEEFSENERFLLAYPFINSFCAQSLLRKFDSIRNLLSLSLDELIRELHDIPQFVLEAFHRVNHTTHDPVIAEPGNPSMQHEDQFCDKRKDNNPRDYQNYPISNVDLLKPNYYNLVTTDDFPRPDVVNKNNVSNFRPFDDHANQATNPFSVDDNYKTMMKSELCMQGMFQNQFNVPNIQYSKVEESEPPPFQQDLLRSRSNDLNPDTEENKQVVRNATTSYSDREVLSTSFDEVDLTNIPDTQPGVYPDRFSDRTVPPASLEQSNVFYYRDDNDLSLYPQDYVNSKTSNQEIGNINKSIQNFEEATSQESIESFRLKLPKCDDGSYSMFPVEDHPTTERYMVKSSHLVDSSVLCTNNNNTAYPSNSAENTFSDATRFHDDNQPTDIQPRSIYQSHSAKIKNLPINYNTRSRNPTVFQPHQHDLYRSASNQFLNENNPQFTQHFDRDAHINATTNQTNHFQINNMDIERGMSNAQQQSNRRFVWGKNSSSEIPRQAVKAFHLSENPNISKSYYDIPSDLANENQSYLSKNTCFKPGRFQSRSTTSLSSSREGDYPNFNTPSFLSPEQKKRKLTYKKVPGSKSGQTKLAFK